MIWAGRGQILSQKHYLCTRANSEKLFKQKNLKSKKSSEQNLRNRRGHAHQICLRSLHAFSSTSTCMNLLSRIWKFYENNENYNCYNTKWNFGQIDSETWNSYCQLHSSLITYQSMQSGKINIKSCLKKLTFNCFLSRNSLQKPMQYDITGCL